MALVVRSATLADCSDNTAAATSAATGQSMAVPFARVHLLWKVTPAGTRTLASGPRHALQQTHLCQVAYPGHLFARPLVTLLLFAFSSVA